VDEKTAIAKRMLAFPVKPRYCCRTCFYNRMEPMAHTCFHPSVEGAQHGAKSLAEFLDYAKNAGATGAQPSNYMLQDGKRFKRGQEIKDTFEQRGMTLDGISAHCPFWVHTSAWTNTPTIRPFLPADAA